MIATLARIKAGARALPGAPVVVMVMVVVLVAVLAASCGQPSPPPVHTYRFEAFATPVTVQVAGAGAAEARAAGERIEAFMTGVQEDWYAYGTGELARANDALARGESFRLSPDLAALVGRARELHRLTGGRFDPSVGDLVELWRFDRAENLAQSAGPPDAGTIARVMAGRGRMEDLSLEGLRLSSRRPVRLDLNGLAKGTAAARAAAILREAGIANALVDLGGSSMVALGTRGERPWRIGVRNPRPAGPDGAAGVLDTLELRPGESVSTSGDYERYLEAGGRRYGHVLDPRTGYPVTHTAAATVVAPDPELAEAATKALMVAGAEGMDAVCRQMGIDLALVVTTTGSLKATPAMARRLKAGVPAR